MKYCFILVLVIVLLTACEESISPTSPNSVDEPMSAVLLESRSLPYNTVTVLDYDRAILGEGKTLIIADISDSNNIQTISQFELNTNEYYNSIQQNRFILTEEEVDFFQCQVIDIENGTKTLIREKEMDVRFVSISPIDYSIIYTAGYFDSSLGNIGITKYIDSNQTTIALNDSTMFPKWSMKKNWFTVSNFMYKQGRFLFWEQALFNLSGEKVILTRDPYSFSRPIWTNDGSALAYHFVQNSGIMIFELDWQNTKPVVIQKVSKILMGDPILWSFDGKYIVHVKHYEDSHIFDILGSQILVSDRNLDLNFTVCDNDSILEMPLKWDENNILITYEADWVWGHYFPLRLKKYKILNY